MSRAVVLLALLAGACTPTFNWREMAVSPANLHTTFPCKPDQAEHKAAILPGREVVLHAMGCETGGATFIVVYADLGSEADLTDAIVEWKKASLASTKSGVDREQPYLPAHALGLSQSVMVRARGQRADGSAVQSQAAYFARGTSVFQAVVYARALKPEMTEPFFTGLRFE
ncbi:MAG TPA: hypothetical protein VIE63_17170 [Ramlibacter sp.]